MARELCPRISGYIGFKILRVALEAGYRVRGIVRKQSGIEALKTTLADGKLTANVEIILVLDLAAPNVFDGLMDKVTYVIHVASPLPSAQIENYERDYQPAVGMTTNILSAAAKPPLVKRVAATSSGSVFIPFESFLQGRTGREVIAATFGHPIQAYAAAKSFALEAAEDFIKTQKPYFDLLSIFPSIIIGADFLQTTLAGLASIGNNKELVNLLLGGSLSPIFGSTVSVQDTATLHIRALDSKIPAGRYLAFSEGGVGGGGRIGRRPLMS